MFATKWREMEVEILSKETIRPSSPTPLHLRNSRLSFLDQLSPPFYVPITWYYPLLSDDGSNDLKKNKVAADCLKDSLSKTLSKFYPLAGRIRDHLWVDCNDEGALFLEAKVKCKLSEFLKEPKIELLHLLLPCGGQSLLPIDQAVHVAVQLNVFSCGGIAISACFLHKIIDGATMSAFLKSWAEIARGSSSSPSSLDMNVNEYNKPDHSKASELFPPKESFSLEMSPLKESWFIKQGKGVWRRFVFNSASISALKIKARSKLVPNPSSVSVVSCFIWKCAMAAASSSSSKHHSRSSMVSFAVNMRSRMSPVLSNYCTGNMAWQALVPHKPKVHGKGEEEEEEEEAKLEDLVNDLKESVAKIDSNVIEQLKGNKESGQISLFTEEIGNFFITEKPEVYVFSSWCKFGFNELDFGWGKPVWTSRVGGDLNPIFINLVILLESPNNGGIEAWMLLDEHEMAVLEHDPRFLSFASFNPTISIPDIKKC